MEIYTNNNIFNFLNEILYNHFYIVIYAFFFYIIVFSYFLILLTNPTLSKYIYQIIDFFEEPLRFLFKFFRRDKVENRILSKFEKHLVILEMDSIVIQSILIEVFKRVGKKYIRSIVNFNINIDETLIYDKFIANEKFLIIFYVLFIEVAKEYNIYLDKYKKEKLFKIIQDIIQLTLNDVETNREIYKEVDYYLERGYIYFLYSTKDFLVYYLNDDNAELEEIKDFLIIDSIRNIKKINVIHGLIDLNRDWPFQVDIVYPDYLNVEMKQVFSSFNININSSNDLIKKIKDNLRSGKTNFSYLVIGESGIGKTTLLTHLFYEILLLYKNKEIPFIPLFFEIKDIDNLFKKNNNIKNYDDFLIFILNEFLKKDMNNQKEKIATIVIDENDGKIYFKYGKKKKRLNNLFNFLKVFPIFDSLDEAYQNIKRGGLKEKKYEFFPYIVSSRTNYFLETVYSKNNFYFCDAVFEIKKWKQEQIEKLINAINRRLKLLYNKSALDEDLKYISINIDNPLLAILLLFTYIYRRDHQNISEISKNKSLLYKSFFETWIERESNRISSIFSKVKKELKVDVLETLYKLFSDSAMFFAWLLYNKQMGVGNENINEIIDKNLNLSIKLEDKLPEIFSSKKEIKIKIYLYNFLKHNEILENQYDKFLVGEDNYFESLFLSNELKSVLQISEKKIDKFIHESFMEFFIAESIIRELSLNYKDVDFKILAYYYRYDITRFVLNLFEYYRKDLIIKIASNLNKFIIEIIQKGNYDNEVLLYQFNWAGYFLSRLLFHNTYLKEDKEYKQYIKTLMEVTRRKEIPHICKRTAYIGLITLGNEKIKKEYLIKLTKDDEFFWFNIGDVLIYYNDKKKDENINLDSWKANFQEFLEGKVSWNSTRKRFTVDILDLSEKNQNLKDYRVKTFLHLVKLELIGYIYRYFRNKHKNIRVKILFNGDSVAFKFFNIELNKKLEDEIRTLETEYLKKLKEDISKYLEDKEKIEEFFSILEQDEDNQFKIIFNDINSYIIKLFSSDSLKS